MFIDHVQPPQRTVYHRFHDALLRVIALALLVLSAIAWLRLVGVGEVADLDIGVAGWRFDLMPTHWRVVVVVMAVLGPVAAVGLWMLSPWGVVLWFALTFFQLAIFAVFADRFEARPALVTFHIICLAVYALTWVRVKLVEREQRLS
ncbi:MAG: DUF6163 family protein [Pseudomonadota bacterium]